MMGKMHITLQLLLFLAIVFHTNIVNAWQKGQELNHDGKMTYVAPAMSTNYVSKSSRDCPWRIRHATSSSATAKITLHVVDEDGNDIEGANVVFAFKKFDTSFSFDYKPSRTKERKTDKSGRASASGESCWDVGFYVEKEGYYPVSGKYLLWVFVTKEIVDWRGRWQPWNPTLRVKMLKKYKPICEWRVFKAKKVPLDVDLAFDAGAIDFCKPYGVGINTNVFLNFTWKRIRENGNNSCSNGVSIATLGNGISIIPKTTDSTMEFPRIMPEKLGSPQFAYALYDVNHKIVFNADPFSTGNVIAIDTLETNGLHRSLLITRLASLYYEKTDNFTIELAYLFNPIPGDSSLEQDTNIRVKGWSLNTKDCSDPRPQRMR